MARILSEADFDKTVERLNHTYLQEATKSFVACAVSDGCAAPQTQELS